MEIFYVKQEVSRPTFIQSQLIGFFLVNKRTNNKRPYFPLNIYLI